MSNWCPGWLRPVCLILLLAAATASPAVDLQFTRVAGINGIVDIRNAGDGSDRLFLVQQAGQVWIFRRGVIDPAPFLDIRSRVQSGGERGLLSIAFAPDFSTSGFFYAWYTREGGDTQLSRFRVTGDPDIADAASEQVLLVVEQPFSNHNGGRLVFGPDGMLYLGLGDGGSGNDPLDAGQSVDTLLGKIIRIDVDPSQGTYAIPPDNPFAGDDGVLDEIWALGVRNPWRISFDRQTGDLYIADVGQNAIEEVNFQPASSAGGENYGWRVMEGSQCNGSIDPNCDTAGLVLPVSEYSHDFGCSITGGEVYRGSAYPALQGTYLFGDFCSGRVWGLTRNGAGWQTEQLADTAFRIITFGEDEAGNVYLYARGDGVYLLSDGLFQINAGLNDAWFNRATPGQGFFVNVFPVIGKVFLAMFTFEIERPDAAVMATLGEPGHRWFTAFGDYADNQAVLDIEITSGGVFDAPDPPVTQVPDGTLVLQFTGCNAGTVTYNIESLNLQGVIPLERLTLDNVALCEVLSSE